MLQEADKAQERPSNTGSDTGLASLVLILRFHGIAIDPAQLAHKFGDAAFGISEILRCAREFQLKARLVESDWERLGRTARRRGSIGVISVHQGVGAARVDK